MDALHKIQPHFYTSSIENASTSTYLSIKSNRHIFPIAERSFTKNTSSYRKFTLYGHVTQNSTPLLHLTRYKKIENASTSTYFGIKSKREWTGFIGKSIKLEGSGNIEWNSRESRKGLKNAAASDGISVAS